MNDICLYLLVWIKLKKLWLKSKSNRNRMIWLWFLIFKTKWIMVQFCFQQFNFGLIMILTKIKIKPNHCQLYFPSLCIFLFFLSLTLYMNHFNKKSRSGFLLRLGGWSQPCPTRESQLQYCVSVYRYNRLRMYSPCNIVCRKYI